MYINDTNVMMEVHSGHRDRLRRRISEHGLDKLKDHEVLEFLLFYVLPRQDTNAIAHDLIDAFGNLNNVLFAGLDELCAVKGVGSRTALWLATLGETVRSFRMLDPAERCRIVCPLDLYRYASSLKMRVRPPCTIQLCLDSDGFLLLQRCLTPSRAWGEKECIFCALEDMLSTKAVHSVILQFAEPRHDQLESYDLHHAAAYAKTLSSLGCSLLDVLIVNETNFISIREEDKLPSFPNVEYCLSLRERYESSLHEYGDLRRQIDPDR